MSEGRLTLSLTSHSLGFDGRSGNDLKRQTFKDVCYLRPFEPIPRGDKLRRGGNPPLMTSPGNQLLALMLSRAAGHGHVTISNNNNNKNNTKNTSNTNTNNTKNHTNNNNNISIFLFYLHPY